MQRAPCFILGCTKPSHCPQEISGLLGKLNKNRSLHCLGSWGLGVARGVREDPSDLRGVSQAEPACRVFQVEVVSIKVHWCEADCVFQWAL